MTVKKNRHISTFAASICLSMLFGCIPIMVPDMAMQPPHSIKLVGANGELSTKQSKVILAKLEKNGDDTNIFDKHLALEAEVVGSPLMVGTVCERSNTPSPRKATTLGPEG